MSMRSDTYIGRAFGAVLMCAVAVAASASAGEIEWPAARSGEPPIVDNPPLNTGGPGSDLSFRIDPSPLEVWQQVADDFVPVSDSTVRRVVWWGFYGGTFDKFPEPAPDTEDFRIRFYGARAGDGLPDDSNILFEENFLNPLRFATGRVILTGPAPPEYVYQIDLPMPLTLEGGTSYWLEIVQAGQIDSHFRWEFSPLVFEPHAFRNINVNDWQRSMINAELAYQILSIPEPATVALLALGTCLFLRRNRLSKGGRMRNPR